MRKQTYLQDYYNYCYDCLKIYLPKKPLLRVTNARSYMGQLETRNYPAINLKAYCIKLSKFRLYVNESLRDASDDEDVINTICHELAHMVYNDHGQQHKDLTLKFEDIVLENLKHNNIYKIYPLV